jgi:hypothetical protein
MDKTDLSLVLALFGALATLLGPIVALAAATFLAGLLVGRR